MADRPTDALLTSSRDCDPGAGVPCLAQIEDGTPRRLLLTEVVTPIGAALLRANHQGDATTISVEPIGDSARVLVDDDAIDAPTRLEPDCVLRIGNRRFRFLPSASLRALLRNDEIREAALTDHAGCLRAAMLADEIDVAYEVARRDESTVSLVMFSIDALDELIERCGEANRPGLEERILDVVRRVLRHDDPIFLAGDNAYALLVSNAPADSVYRLGTRIRDAVEAAPLETGDDATHATVSVVIAHGPTGNERPVQLLERGHRTLDFARMNGANQVLV